jgi:hypothetical protein
MRLERLRWGSPPTFRQAAGSLSELSEGLFWFLDVPIAL